MIKAILFDLDGTLNLMDQDVFTPEYVNKLVEYAISLGYEPEEFLKALFGGIGAMAENDGSRLNCDVFWDAMEKGLGKRALNDKDKINAFYETDFDALHAVCPDSPRAPELIKKLKGAGYLLAIASNPIFPITGHNMRLGWTGLDPKDFDHISAYDNSHYCKPNPKYFLEVAENLGVDPAECIMVGNNAKEDMAASATGMDTFLVNYRIINDDNVDITNIKSGDYDALLDYLGVK